MDFRFRKYVEASSLSITLPLSRCFIRFYKSIPIYAHNLTEIKDLLIIQLNSLSTKIKPTIIDTSNLTLENIFKYNEYTYGKYFSAYNLITDIHKCDKGTRAKIW